jgi:transcriptional regulator with GAF, ATPase, and Fis domain
MRWQVREAGGGAEAMAQLESQGAEAMVLDTALPDLEVGEFANQMRLRHPEMDLLRVGAGTEDVGSRSPHRNELLHALRQAQEGGGYTRSARNPMQGFATGRAALREDRAATPRELDAMQHRCETVAPAVGEAGSPEEVRAALIQRQVIPLPEMVGDSPGMMELARMVRLVAPTSTTVLIQGETGTGKELVAKAVHKLSPRANKPFMVLNCAAIPEALLEAELFGHTRGAFTGAVQSRTGRIEAAHGGTLFLDEIGEMPLALQAKMLRFLESGELQRVGDNETLHVNVRVVAASHQPLQQRSKERAFRLDLYHRLAVFPVFVPALRDRMEDVLPLAAYLLARLGEVMPMKRLSAGGAMKLMEHDWPGNVRELAHVLERGVILAEDRREIATGEIRY